MEKKQYKPNSNHEKVKQKRRNTILKYLLIERDMESTYRECRKNGYAMRRTTFKKDIFSLLKQKQILLIKNRNI